MSRDMEGQICEQCREGVYRKHPAWGDDWLRCDNCGRQKAKYSGLYKGRYLQATWHEETVHD